MNDCQYNNCWVSRWCRKCSFGIILIMLATLGHFCGQRVVLWSGGTFVSPKKLSWDLSMNIHNDFLSGFSGIKANVFASNNARLGERAGNKTRRSYSIPTRGAMSTRHARNRWRASVRVTDKLCGNLSKICQILP